MQTKILSTIFSLMLALVLASCAAVQYPAMVTAVNPATTIQGMQQAVNGAPGTFILQQGNNLVLGWPVGSNYSWVAISTGGKFVPETLKDLCGNKACPEVASDIYNFLVEKGWQQVPSGAIPLGVVSTIRQFSYLITIGASLPVIPVLLMPAQLDPIKMINPEVKS